MKKVIQNISITALMLFIILFVTNKLNINIPYNSSDVQSLVVLIYLFTRMKYNQMEINEKEQTIKELNKKLNRLENKYKI